MVRRVMMMKRGRKKGECEGIEEGKEIYGGMKVKECTKNEMLP